MIMFGDMDFFTSGSVRNKSGQRLWLEFLSLLEAGGHVYRKGLPAVCEIHKTRVDLSSPEAFDKNVPDGGCRVVCGTQLPCGVRGHLCPRRCKGGGTQTSLDGFRTVVRAGVARSLDLENGRLLLDHQCIVVCAPQNRRPSRIYCRAVLFCLDRCVRWWWWWSDVARSVSFVARVATKITDDTGLHFSCTFNKENKREKRCFVAANT